MNQFISPADEQAEEIVEMLEDNGLAEPGELDVDEIEQGIDPDKPVSVNFKEIADGLNGIDRAGIGGGG